MVKRPQSSHLCTLFIKALSYGQENEPLAEISIVAHT